MKSLFKILLVFLSFYLFSCAESQENSTAPYGERLLGAWVHPVYKENVVSYEKGTGLIANDYGILFQANHVFTDRNSGFCGTPPLTFMNSNGTWEVNKTIITINMSSEFNQLEGKQWKIILLQDQVLKLEPMNN
ncbi:MAG: hypothetical protein COB98_04850 [Flavobacteriaceae bacterium]|nr:MAG: hypothetical protein COB98_04850 [Flavobacteriaceae bacterium]